jgi:hypothetical protein
MYMKDNYYLGRYSNNKKVAPITSGESDFGLESYKPLFFWPLPQWTASRFSVSLTFHEYDYKSDIFNF